MDSCATTSGRRRIVDPRVDRQRDRGRRRDRRLDERGAAPAGDRPRVRDPARHRRLRADRRPDADRRRPPARRPVRGDRPVPGGRRRARHARAAQGRPHRRRGADRRRAGRSPRSRPRPSRRPGRSCRPPIEQPIKPSGGLTILTRQPRPGRLRRQARRSRAAAITAARRASSTPRRTCFAAVSERRDRRRRRRRHPLRGARRRPGHAGDAGRDRRRWSARGSATSVALLTDGRFSRRHPRPDDRPRRPRGRARRPDRARRGGRHRSSSTSTRAASTWRSRPTRSLARRRGPLDAAGTALHRRRRSRSTRPSCRRPSEGAVTTGAAARRPRRADGGSRPMTDGATRLMGSGLGIKTSPQASTGPTLDATWAPRSGSRACSTPAG